MYALIVSKDFGSATLVVALPKRRPKTMSDENLNRWANYYRYFYFNEEMTFEYFLRLVKAGVTPKRSYVNWTKVGGHLDTLEEEAI